MSSVIFSGIILLPFTGNFIKTITNPEAATNMVNVASNPLFIILSALVSALTLPLMPIFAAVLISMVKPEKNRIKIYYQKSLKMTG